jgi:excisionase family DNA binding protein
MQAEPTRPAGDRTAAANDEERSDNRLTYTLTEVAEQLGISRALAYRAAKRGELPVLLIGRRMVVPRSAFLRFLHQDEPPQQAS